MKDKEVLKRDMMAYSPKKEVMWKDGERNENSRWDEKNLGCENKKKMKIKNKVLASLEIAIVLCSLFLMVLPATTIAAGQDDYVLCIYGNANEDDTIDMRDLTYEKLIFFGEKPETELADAKYDGKINPLDFIQIKLIIVGKEKELTLVDTLGKAVTVHKPVKRIIVIADTQADVIRVLGAVDRVVGVGTEMKDKPLHYPVMSKLPDVGGVWGAGIDIEALLNLNPDIVLTYSSFPSTETLEDKLKETDISVIRLDFIIPTTIEENFLKIGYILDKKEEAKEFIDWHNEYMDKIQDRTDGLSEDDKPRVYIEADWGNFVSFSKTTTPGELCTMAGGINIASDLTGKMYPVFPEVDPEWILKQDPDIIIDVSSGRISGYDIDDLTGIKAKREEMMNRPGWDNIAAVKNGKFYMITMEFRDAPQICVMGAYMAKWFHPDLFEDLDPQAVHQEYLDRFHKDLNFDVYEHGVFAYPEPS
jgi:iron complex transport system substrate-binding protein